MTILGYADRLSVRPGDELAFKVSADRPYAAEIVRLDRAWDTPRPEAWQETVVHAVPGIQPAREQPIHPGSFARVDALAGADLGAGVTLDAWIWPTLPADGREQGVIAQQRDGAGWLLGLDGIGRPLLVARWPGGDAAVTCETPLRPREWVRLTGRITADGVSLEATRAARGWLAGSVERAETGAAVALPAVDAPLLIAAGAWVLDGGRGHAAGHFNGKIEHPSVATLDGAAIAGWDFSVDPAGFVVPDAAGNGNDAAIVNHPARMMTGHAWDGQWHDWRSRPGEFAACHFHDDDIDDLGWETSFTLPVPDLPSGIYAARLRHVDRMAPGPMDMAEEYVPFYLRPRVGASAARVAFLAPTNTYLAYANERLIETVDAGQMTDQEVFPSAEDEFLRAHPELGASLYDHHRDGSGICYSTRLRPVLTMRPKFRAWINDGTRHFGADLHVVEWLEHEGVPFDVLTDEDLHVDGLDAISGYAVVLTGSHPEYWTAPMMDALRAYLAGGGRLMYLGGNGFYWVTGMAEGRPQTIEVRRGFAGTRCWESAPGEVHLSTTGEQGGLWRYRGAGPNTVVGIGFAAQGWGGSEGYDRLPDSRRPEAAFIFEGVGEDEVIGDFGIVMGGAAGDEIDRADPDNGTPPETLVLATSGGRHSDYYQLTIEDAPMMLANMGGQTNPKVRSDLTYLPGPNGGAVFSVGSINWTGSLASNGFDNNVARITGNVLRRFMAD